MEPPFYEINESVEERLRHTIESGGGSLSPKGTLKKSGEGEEQYWSVSLNNVEVFWFSVALENTGRRLLIMGPKRKSPHSHLYDMCVSVLEPSGAKRLEKL